MKRVHFLHVYNKRMLCEHDCAKFRGRIAWHSFLENNFAEFLDEVGKNKSRFRPVICDASLQQHLLLGLAISVLFSALPWGNEILKRNN